MRYLSLAEALTIAQAVTGTSAGVLARASRLDLLDSALHAPQAGFGDVEFYPEFADKAAVLAVRIAKNHPLPDGNKRLAWQSLTMFCALNGFELEVPTNDAVDLMLGVAAGDLLERAAAGEELTTAGRAASDIAAQAMVMAFCTPTWFVSERQSLIHDAVERELRDRATNGGQHVLFTVDACSHVLHNAPAV